MTDWMRILSYPTSQRFPIAALAVQEELAKLAPGQWIGTRELTERLWPEASVVGAAQLEARATRLPQLILRIRAQLPGWWRQGEEIVRKGKTVRPIEWTKGPTLSEEAGKARRRERVDILALQERVERIEAKLIEFSQVLAEIEARYGVI